MKADEPLDALDFDDDAILDHEVGAMLAEIC